MKEWLDSAAGPAIAAIVGWGIAQVGGGLERRRQEHVTWLLDVADRLGASPAGRESAKLAEQEAAAILELRGTRGWLAWWMFLTFGCGLIALSLVVAGLLAHASGVARGSTAATGVLYAGFAVFAAREVRNVFRLRARQRPAPSIEIAR